MPDWTRRGWALRNARRRQGQGWVGTLALLVLVMGALYLLRDSGADGAIISGAAHVVDGDTVRIGDERIRLLGLDAPELDQTCGDAAGRDWNCGSAAREALARLVSGGALECNGERRDQYGRLLAHCTAGGKDVGGAIVSEGLAVANGDYAREEAEARAGHRGLWAGRFEHPRDWRDKAAGFDLWSWIGAWFG